MKKVLALAVCLVVAAGVFADTVEEINARLEQVDLHRRELVEDYRRHKVIQWIGWGTAFTGALIAGAFIPIATETADPWMIGFTVGGYGVMFGGLAVGIIDRIRTQPDRAEIERQGYIINGLIVEREAALRAVGFSGTEQDAIEEGQIYLGMPEAAMLASLGQPIDMNRTVTSGGEHKQFVYPNGLYVYTEDGVVTSWQD